MSADAEPPPGDETSLDAPASLGAATEGNGIRDAGAKTAVDRAVRHHPVATELLAAPEALLTRTHLRELGLERRAVDAVFRALPVVALPGYSRPMVRVQDYIQLVEHHTYRDDRVRPPMPSVWIERRDTPHGRTRYLVKYRLGGRESAHRYAGSFATQREALARSRWVAGELAAMRVPHRRELEHATAEAPTLVEAGERWRASRVDVTEGTAIGHRVQLNRVLPRLGSRRVDEITPADVAELVTALHAAGRKRETIRKSLTVLAQVLDFAGVRDNPARDRVHVRLPRGEREEPTPPTAGQIESVLPLMPPRYALAVLVLDATGMRVGELEEKGLLCSDLDEPNTRWRIRRAVEKGRRGRWVSLPPDLFAAVIATLPPREDRAPDQPVFPGLTQERLRTAIVRACKASGTPTWSPHDLRHRRISLWHRQGETWALIGARVGQRSLSVTADTYTHVLLDDRELDHARLVGQLEVTRA